MKILLPIDGSAVCLEAVRFAIRMAQEGLPVSYTHLTLPTNREV